MSLDALKGMPLITVEIAENKILTTSRETAQIKVQIISTTDIPTIQLTTTKFYQTRSTK